MQNSMRTSMTKHSDWNIFKKVTKNIKNNNHKFKALFTLKHLKLVIFQIKLINKWIEICKTNYKKRLTKVNISFKISFHFDW